MKILATIGVLFLSMYAFSQDSIAKVEPDHTTSFDNYRLLIIAIAGLAILVAVRLWFKRRKR